MYCGFNVGSFKKQKQISLLLFFVFVQTTNFPSYAKLGKFFTFIEPTAFKQRRATQHN